MGTSCIQAYKLAQHLGSESSKRYKKKHIEKCQFTDNFPSTKQAQVNTATKDLMHQMLTYGDVLHSDERKTLILNVT